MTEKTFSVTFSVTREQLEALRSWQSRNRKGCFAGNTHFNALLLAELPVCLPEVVPGNLVRVWWNWGEKTEGTMDTGEVVVRVDDRGFDTGYFVFSLPSGGGELRFDEVAGVDRRYDFVEIDRIEILLNQTPGVRL